jgi:hypothetical protein
MLFHDSAFLSNRQRCTVSYGRSIHLICAVFCLAKQTWVQCSDTPLTLTKYYGKFMDMEPQVAHSSVWARQIQNGSEEVNKGQHIRSSDNLDTGGITRAF